MCVNEENPVLGPLPTQINDTFIHHRLELAQSLKQPP